MFLIWNTPALASNNTQAAYGFIQLAQVAIIAFAGLAANLRLFQLLQRISGSKRVAKKIVVAWLVANLFLGSQLCWILRPFIGSPYLPIQFIRPDAFRGNFYETVWFAASAIFAPKPKPEKTYD
jgi:predicted membrane-bound spermidine synthase